MKKHSLAGLARLALLAAASSLAACASPPSTGAPAPFTTDGCSLFPDRSVTGQVDWCECCLAHDLAYWRGGTQEERLQADAALRGCVARKAQNPALADTMFLGVRAGGGPLGHAPYRWGYGWPPGRGYQVLTEAEAAAVQALEQDYRARNPALQCEAPKKKAAGPRLRAGDPPTPP